VTALRRRILNLVEEVRLPRVAREFRRRDQLGLATVDPGPRAAIEFGIAWLARAQDCSKTKDGGVARHFGLIDGWSASYPETTGYIVATLLDYARKNAGTESIERATKMLDWLVSIQFDEGGFQGGMINQHPKVPVTFNTGQILIGLAAGAHLSPRYRAAMRKAADWLIDTQDDDGCWRRFPTPFADGGEKTYETHVALALFLAHEVEPFLGYQQAGLRQVKWALRNQVTNGWLSSCCLSDPSQPLTHTLGYALRGVVGAHLSSRDQQFLDAACRTANGLLTAIESDGRLPGRLDSNWQSTADWVCLTGSCQIAESFLLLHKEAGNSAYLHAAKALNSYVRRTIFFDGPRDVVGGVKGSFPVGGQYGQWQYLNWACKFMIDANQAELNAG